MGEKRYRKGRAAAVDDAWQRAATLIKQIHRSELGLSQEALWDEIKGEFTCELDTFKDYLKPRRRPNGVDVFFHVLAIAFAKKWPDAAERPSKQQQYISRLQAAYYHEEDLGIESIGETGATAIPQDSLRKIDETHSKVNELITALAPYIERATHQGLMETTLRMIAMKIGAQMNNAPIEDILRLIDDFIEVATREKRTVSQGDSSDLTKLRIEAFRFLDAGQLDQASSPFDAVIDLRRKARTQRTIDEALDDMKLLEEAALYDRLAFNIDRAVKRYIDAAALSTDGDLSYLSAKAESHLAFGRDQGDNTSLLISVGLLRALVLKIDRAGSPLAWASVENRIGNVLSLLGGREISNARLHEAIDAYGEALDEYARQKLPQDWAAVQNNIAVAYRLLGERETNTAYLKMARQACIEALEVCPRSRAREQWANIQLNLGNACTLLGGRDDNIKFLNEGVRAYRQCLSEHARARSPQVWAQAQTNLGNAFCQIAVKFGGRKKGDHAVNWLRKALDAYSKALSETRRETLPLKWADLQHNVGNSLFMLGAALWLRGEPETGIRYLQSATTALREALHERTFERVPLRWADTQEILGDTLLFIGDVEKRPDQLEQAILVFRESLKQRTPDRDARRVAALNDKIFTAESLLAGRRERSWLA